MLELLFKFPKKKDILVIFFFSIIVWIYISKDFLFIKREYFRSLYYEETKETFPKKYVIYQCVDGMLCGGWGDR